MNLKEEVKLLREELRQTKEALQKALKRIEELEGVIKEKNKPSFVKENICHNYKKTGQKKGHKGYARHIPERIDKIVEHQLAECPNCGGHNLSDVQEERERVITDIPEQKAVNTLHTIERRYCRDCKRMVEAQINEALPNARVGLRLMLLVLIMKLDSRIPSNKLTSLLEMLYGVKISDGEIYVILEQLSKALGSYYDELVKKIKEALIKNIDETSWRINGKNNWLWLFINKEVALYMVNQKRSSKVPIETLGNQEGKFVTSDRLPAYDELSKKSKCKQQMCWAHLLRNSKDLAEHYREAKYIHKRMKYIYQKAKEGRTSKEKLLHWIDLIASRVYTSSEVFKFVKSICRNHIENLFRFVDNPEVESTNNRAERGLRHVVVMRKISNGSRSEKGAEITGRLLSVTETIKMNHSNPIDAMIGLLQNTK